MKNSRLVLGLALAAGLLLAYWFLHSGSNEGAAPQESIAAANEPDPGQPPRAAFEAKDPFRVSSPGDVPQPPESGRTGTENPARGESDLGDGLRASGREAKASADPRVTRGTLALIDEEEIPAEEAGKLIELKTVLKDADGKPILKDEKVQWSKEVKEGLEVSKGDLIAQIDDMQPRMAKRVADAEFEAAQAEATNDVSVRHAEALYKVSLEDYKGAQDADKQAPQSIPKYDMNKLWFKCEESSMQIEQAKHELKIASLKAAAAKAKSDAAEQDIQRRQIKAHISGEIVERFKHEGEWVKPGDRVYRLVRLDRLQIKAELDPTKILPAEVVDKPVTLKVDLPHGVQKTFRGQIRWASPIVNSGRTFLIIVEVPNKKEAGYWVLRPGFFATVTVETSGQGALSAAGGEAGPAREVVAGRPSTTPENQ